MNRSRHRRVLAPHAFPDDLVQLAHGKTVEVVEVHLHTGTAPKLIRDGHASFAALILCFVGAVEENLPGMEPITGRSDRHATQVGPVRTAAYLSAVPEAERRSA